MEHRGYIRGRLATMHYGSLHIVKRVCSSFPDGRPIYYTFCGNVPCYEEFCQQPPENASVCRSCQSSLNAAIRKEEGRVSRSEDKLSIWRKELHVWTNGQDTEDLSAVKVALEADRVKECHDRITLGNFLMRTQPSVNSTSTRVWNRYFVFAQRLLDVMEQAGISRRDSQGWYRLANTS